MQVGEVILVFQYTGGMCEGTSSTKLYCNVLMDLVLTRCETLINAISKVTGVVDKS